MERCVTTKSGESSQRPEMEQKCFKHRDKQLLGGAGTNKYLTAPGFETSLSFSRSTNSKLRAITTPVVFYPLTPRNALAPLP